MTKPGVLLSLGQQTVNWNLKGAKIINEIRSLGVNIQPWKGGKEQWIECSFGDKWPIYLQVRQRYFNYESYDEDEEVVSLRLYSYAEWAEKAKEDLLRWCGRAKVST